MSTVCSKQFLGCCLLFTLLGCSIIQPKHVYEYCDRTAPELSEIKNNQLISSDQQQETTLSGNVTGKRENKPVVYATAVLSNWATGSVTNTLVDSLGDFEFSPTPGWYQLRISCIGFSDFKIDSLLLEVGDQRTLDVLMGSVGGYTMYEFRSRKKLSTEDLKALAKKMQEAKQ